MGVIHGPWDAASDDARAYLIRLMPRRAYLFERMEQAELEGLVAQAKAIAMNALTNVEPAYQAQKESIRKGDRFVGSVALVEVASGMADALKTGDSLQALYEKTVAALLCDRIERGLFPTDRGDSHG